LILDLFANRANYFLGTRMHPEVPLSRIERDPRSNAWFRVAEGKGVLLLNELRWHLGPDGFDAMMKEFGKTHAGRPVSTSEFRTATETVAKKKLAPFFDFWLNGTGLPSWRLGEVKLKKEAEKYVVHGKVQAENDFLASTQVYVKVAENLVDAK